MRQPFFTALLIMIGADGAAPSKHARTVFNLTGGMRPSHPAVFCASSRIAAFLIVSEPLRF